MENETTPNGVEVTMVNLVSGNFHSAQADAATVFTFDYRQKSSQFMFTGMINAEDVASGFFAAFVNPETPELIKKVGYGVFIAMTNNTEFRKNAVKYAMHKIIQKAQEQKAQNGAREELDG